MRGAQCLRFSLSSAKYSPAPAHRDPVYDLVPCRLTASQSFLLALVCTPIRRGLPFARARRHGLRSMSGRYSYGIDNPPTLRRSSFPQRVVRPVWVPKCKTRSGRTPRPPTLGCAGYECCFSAGTEKQIRTARRCAPKVACGGSSDATYASIGQTLRYTAGSPLRCGASSSPHKVLRPCRDPKSPRAGARRANHHPCPLLKGGELWCG